MKKLITLTLLLVSISAFAQTHLVEITLDGKPAILNTKTGETIYANGSSSASVNQSESTTSINADIIDTHQVEKGDTLYSISKKYGVSMAQIKAVNNLKTNVLSVNQILKIGYVGTTIQANTESEWVVSKGDTLYSISKKTGVSVLELKNLNNLPNNIIAIGQKLNLK